MVQSSRDSSLLESLLHSCWFLVNWMYLCRISSEKASILWRLRDRSDLLNLLNPWNPEWTSLERRVKAFWLQTDFSQMEAKAIKRTCWKPRRTWNGPPRLPCRSRPSKKNLLQNGFTAPLLRWFGQVQVLINYEKQLTLNKSVSFSQEVHQKFTELLRVCKRRWESRPKVSLWDLWWDLWVQ